MHEVNGTPITEVIGVVADSEEEAKEACTAMLTNVTFYGVVDGGHVRFIRHVMRGPATKVTFNGEAIETNPS